MTRREREQRIEWCYKRIDVLGALFVSGNLLPHKQKELNDIYSELAHYARQDRRRAKRRMGK